MSGQEFGMDTAKWIFDHAEAIFAVIGAAYTLALLIVKLTPTPADDEALEKVHRFVLTVASIFRIKIQTQQEKDEKKDDKTSGRAHVAILLVVSGVLLALAAGCNSPGDQYQASSMAFVAAVDAASELRRAGKLSDEEVKAIDAAVDAGNSTLARWAQAIKADSDYPEGTDVIEDVVKRIREYLVARRVSTAPVASGG